MRDSMREQAGLLSLDPTFGRLRVSFSFDCPSPSPHGLPFTHLLPTEVQSYMAVRCGESLSGMTCNIIADGMKDMVVVVAPEIRRPCRCRTSVIMLMVV